jgi:hypothetical protein
MALALISCTIRIEPYKPKVKYVYRSSHKHQKHHHGEKPLSGEMVPAEDVKLIEPHATPPP